MVATTAATVGLGFCALGLAAVVALLGGLFLAADQACQRERGGRRRAENRADRETKRANKAEKRAAGLARRVALAERDRDLWFQAYERAAGDDLNATWAHDTLAQIQDLPEWGERS